jgi:hypothetical protein
LVGPVAVKCLATEAEHRIKVRKSWEGIFRILTRVVDPSDHNIPLGEHLKLADTVLDLDEQERIVDWIKFLSKAGFDFDDPREEIAPALLAATSSKESTTWMELLLKCGADPNVTLDGKNALHCVLLFGRKKISDCPEVYDKTTNIAREDILVLLLLKLMELIKAGCDIHAIDNSGRTPSMLAKNLDLLEFWRKALELCGLVYKDVVAADTEIFRSGWTSGTEVQGTMRDRTYLRKRR